MATRVAGGKTLPDEVLREIVNKTDGVALFVEELTKMVLESGLLREAGERYELAGPLPPLAIPATLQDSLMARLDRLAHVKEVAQLGATLGRAFPYSLIRAVSALEEPTLQRELGRLVEAELLYQRGMPPEATYVFKHALIQEAAYQSLLRATRQQYHQRIARAMEERFPTEAEARPEFVAHHYTEAGLAREAVEYWRRAGRRAVQCSAYAEAIVHFEKALEVLATCPESPDRDQRELALQVALGYAVVPAKGWTAPGVERAFSRARSVSQGVRETPLLVAALWGLGSFYLQNPNWQQGCAALVTALGRPDQDIARELYEHCVAVAERLQDPDLLVEAYEGLGANSTQRGEFTAARGQLERSISPYDRQRHRARAFRYGHDPCVGSLYWLNTVLWHLGYAEQAMMRAREGMVLARGLSHPFSVGMALIGCSRVRIFRREWREAQATAEESLALSAEQRFPLYAAMSAIYRGVALANQGHPEHGIVQIKQGLAARRAMGTGSNFALESSFLAEACARAGQVDDGLDALAEALTFIEKTGERYWEAEIWRLRGELLLIQAALGEPEAEVCFRRALETARRQQAKTLELRAATSLSRLWQRHGKRADARRLLSEVYGWFTEGFDTPDLKDAKALLGELA